MPWQKMLLDTLFVSKGGIFIIFVGIIFSSLLMFSEEVLLR